MNNRKNIIRLDPTKEHHKDSNAVATVGLICIGLILGMILLAGIRAWDRQSVAHVVVQLPADFCMTCHITRQNLKIKNLKQFKAAHPSPLAQRRLLEELENAR